jgi:hypothetical protein
MRRTRPRITVRQMMVAVALAGLAVWGERMVRRRNVYLDRANYFSIGESVFLDNVDEPVGYCGLMRVGLSPDEKRQFDAEQDQINAEARKWRLATASYYGTLKRKYGRAALYPWLPVDADPPPPEW